jgi:hypothetical protein
MWLGEIGPDTTVARLDGIDRLTGSDLAAMKRTADALGVPVDSLATIISIESRFSPAAVNRLSNATGLIGFMPSTALSLGTTVEALRNMTFQEQLPFVERFYKGNRCTGFQDVGELYVCTFCPALLGTPDSNVVARKDEPSRGPCGTESKVYSQNSGLDKDKDDMITAGDVRNVARNRLSAAVGRVPIEDMPTETGGERRGGLGWLLGGIVVGGVIAYATGLV